MNTIHLGKKNQDSGIYIHIILNFHKINIVDEDYYFTKNHIHIKEA